jgi:hypothetical protein
MKIGISGCSHSGGAYGNPWHYYMSKHLDSDIIDCSSSGSGNEINIEKIKHILENTSDLDFFVYQITDPSRLVLGLTGNNIEEEYNKFYIIKYKPNNLNSHRQFKNVDYYTFQVSDKNNNYLNDILNTNYDIQQFMINHILTSDFNLKIKIFHTLMTIQHLCNHYNKKILFFSWVIDIKKLAEENGYGDIIRNMNIIDGNVVDFCDKNKMDKYKVDLIHLNSDGHEIIYNDYIKPNLNEFIK